MSFRHINRLFEHTRKVVRQVVNDPKMIIIQEDRSTCSRSSPVIHRPSSPRKTRLMVSPRETTSPSYRKIIEIFYRDATIWKKLIDRNLYLQTNEGYYHLQSLLGSGMTGFVFQGLDRDGNLVAIKSHVRKESENINKDYPIWDEFSICQKIKEFDFKQFPDIIDYFLDTDMGLYGIEFMIMKYCPVSLHSLLSRGDVEKWSDYQCLNVCRQLIELIYNFHTKTKFIHNDIKPGNILFQSDMLIGTGENLPMICDFGASSRASEISGEYTKWWASINISNGGMSRFIDDFESVGYVICAILRRHFGERKQIPWNEFDKLEDINTSKFGILKGEFDVVGKFPLFGQLKKYFDWVKRRGKIINRHFKVRRSSKIVDEINIDDIRGFFSTF